MFSELECGICYQIYNAGRRCPRELHCKHSFCESCLTSLCLPPGQDTNAEPDRSIVCPLCRQVTAVCSSEKIRAALRVDEGVLERLAAEGVLDSDDTDEDCEVNGCQTVSQSAETADSSSSPRSTGGKLKLSWKRVWGKIIGKNPSSHCMTRDDLRALAMVSYLF